MTDDAQRWELTQEPPAISMWDDASLHHPVNDDARRRIVAQALVQRDVARTAGLDIREVLALIAAVLRSPLPP